MSLTRFETNDGIELVIDTETGEAFATQAGYARMSGLSQQAINKRCSSYNRNELKIAEMPTVAGVRTYNLIPASLVFKWLMRDNPDLAEKMGEAGATVFMHQLAGYKVESSLSEAKEPNTEIDVLIEQQLLTLNALVDTRKRMKDLERQNQEAVARVELVESKIQVFENRAIEAEKELKALPPAITPCPSRTARNNINTLVRGYCHKNNINHRMAWNNLYREFRDRYHFDLKTRANNRGNTSPLDIAESFSLIDDLYSLAVELFA